jgi:hypothetical protein
MSTKLAIYQPPRAGLPRRLPAEAMAQVRGYQRASKASATVRACRGDAAAFDAWCARHELHVTLCSMRARIPRLAHIELAHRPVALAQHTRSSKAL